MSGVKVTTLPPLSFGPLPTCALVLPGKRRASHSHLICQALYDAGDALFVTNVGAMVEPTTKLQYQKGQTKTPYGLFGHAGQQEDAKSCHSGKGSTAHGILGRITKALGRQAFASNLYSTKGNQKSLEGGKPPDILTSQGSPALSSEPGHTCDASLV
jgi:hypothetical protein